MKIAITGSNGLIGLYLTEFFLEKGYTVYGLQRKKPKISHKNFKYYRYELEEENFNFELVNVDVIVHTAYLEYSKLNKDADNINFKGTQTIVNFYKGTKTKIIFLSTLSAHENAKSHYGISKFKTEKLFENSKHLVLKLGLVVGKGGLFETINKFVNNSFLIPLIDGGKQPIQLIHWNDLCKIIEKSISMKNLKGIFYVGSGDKITMKDLYVKIINKRKLTRIFINIPIYIIKLVIRVVEFFNLPIKINSENIKGLETMKFFETKKTYEILGINQTSLDKTIGIDTK